MSSPDNGDDAEFWSQAENEETPKVNAGSTTDESVDDFFNKASNDDIYAFS